MALILKKDRFQKPIDSKTISFDEFISINKKLIIPDFQRNYAWKNDNVKGFIDDISDMVNNNDQFVDGGFINYVGEFFLSNLDSDEADVYSLVDGQQRMITLTLALLSCFWQIRLLNKNLNNLLKRMSKTKDFDYFEFNNKVNNEAQAIKNFLSFDDKLFITSKNESDESVLKILSRFDDKPSQIMDDVKSSKNNIAKMFIYINDSCLSLSYTQSSIKNPNSIQDEKVNDVWVELSKVIDEYASSTKDQFIDEIRDSAFQIFKKIGFYKNFSSLLIQKTMLTSVKSEDSSSAFVIFETLNNTGLDLKPWDLVKGKIMATINPKSTVAKKFLDISESINKSELKSNANNTFLGYWLNSVINSFIPESQYYEMFKKISSNNFEKNVESLTNDLEFFKKWFENKNSWLQIIYKNLNEPKAYSIISLMNRKTNLYSKDSFNFLLDLAAVIFVSKNILSENYAEIDTKEILSEVKSELSTLDIAKELPTIFDLLSDPKNKYMNAFYRIINEERAFKTISEYRTDDFGINTLILYWLLEKDSKNFSPDEYSDLTVEHAIPRNPNQKDIDQIIETNSEWSTWSDENKWNSNPYVSNIGNLYILDRSVNSTLSNDGLESKADKLFFLKSIYGTDAVLEKDMNTPDYKNISPASIERRGAKLMSDFVNKVLLNFRKN